MLNLFNLIRFNLVTTDEVAASTKYVAFNGMSIGDVVPDSAVIDVVIGAPRIISTAYDRSFRHGSEFVRRRFGERKVIVTIEAPLNRDEYAENMRRLRRWADSDEAKELYIAAYPDRVLMATCTNLADFSPKEWWMPMEIEFTAWEPFFLSRSVNSMQVGSSGLLEFTAGGDAPPVVNVSLSAGSGETVSAPQVIVDDGKFVKLLGDLTNGEMKIDFDHRSTFVGDEEAEITLTSRYALIENGTHKIQAPAGSVVYWRERWM